MVFEKYFFTLITLYHSSEVANLIIGVQSFDCRVSRLLFVQNLLNNEDNGIGTLHANSHYRTSLMQFELSSKINNRAFTRWRKGTNAEK